MTRRRMLQFIAIPVLAGATMFATVILAAPAPPQAQMLSPPPVRKNTVTVPMATDATKFGTLRGTVRQLPSLASGLPRPLPTNAWWSSGVLEAWPAPLFAWPLVTSFAQNGVTIDAPGQSTLPNAVVSAPRDPLVITPNAGVLTRAVVHNWGDWNVTFDLRKQDDSSPLSVTAVQGSPFVFLMPRTALSIALPLGSTTEKVACAQCGGAIEVHAPHLTYLFVAPPDATLTSEAEILQFSSTKAESLLTVALIADGTVPADYLSAALRPIRDTRVSYRVLPDTVETTYRFSAPTLMGILPHQQPVLSGATSATLGTYSTVHGTIRVIPGQTFTTVLPRPAILPGLPLTHALKGDPSFTARLNADIAEHRISPPEIYGAAKDLLRTATLAELADDLGNHVLRAQSVTDLQSKLVDWCTTNDAEQQRYFAYDPSFGGIIGIPAAFGSEHYNDHHFHYGYFLRAGATLARFDPTFVTQYGDCMRLLAKDIANFDRRSTAFPFLRSFDVYAGHSWANGITRFADGQNQESSSEAMQAWFGLALWGKASNDKILEDEGTWLLAQEAQSTRTYWFNATADHPTLPAEYSHPMISILWGGKADYATFFDADPSAIQGIQFFPATTSLLSVMNKTILSTLVAPMSDASSNALWKTNMNLVSALDGHPVSLPDDAAIDSAYSRSGIKAWLSSLAQLGPYQEQYHATGGCNGAVFGLTTKTAVIFRSSRDPDTCVFQAETPQPIIVKDLALGWNSITL